MDFILPPAANGDPALVVTEIEGRVTRFRRLVRAASPPRKEGGLRATAARALIERRRCHRRAAKYPIILIVDEQGRTISRVASTFDVSDLGARVTANARLAVGQSVRVILHEANQEFVPSRVVWVGERAQGAHEAGIEFLPKSSTDPKAPIGQGP